MSGFISRGHPRQYQTPVVCITRREGDNYVVRVSEYGDDEDFEVISYPTLDEAVDHCSRYLRNSMLIRGAIQ